MKEKNDRGCACQDYTGSSNQKLTQASRIEKWLFRCLIILIVCFTICFALHATEQVLFISRLL